MLGCACVSLVLHGATYASLGSVDEALTLLAAEDAEVEFTVQAPPEPPVPDIPDPPAPEEPEVIKVPKRNPKPAPRPKDRKPTKPPEQAPAPAAETPVDFGNLNLTAEGSGSSWAIDPGSGREMEGPIGAPGARTDRRVEGRRDGVVGGRGAGPKTVALADLSRRPTPPAQAVLNRLLKRFYPKALERQGIPGVARVRAVLLNSGPSPTNPKV